MWRSARPWVRLVATAGLAHAPAKQLTAVAVILKNIFAQETKVEADAQWANVADALREKQPKLGALMDASRDDVLA
jgi:putative transposase